MKGPAISDYNKPLVRLSMIPLSGEHCTYHINNYENINGSLRPVLIGHVDVNKDFHEGSQNNGKDDDHAEKDFLINRNLKQECSIVFRHVLQKVVEF